MREYDAVEAFAREAVATFDRLRATGDWTPKDEWGAHIAKGDVAWVFRLSGQSDKALEIQEALVIELQDLSGRYAGSGPIFWKSIAETYMNWAYDLSQHAQYVKADQAYTKAVNILKEKMQLFPSLHEYPSYLANAYADWGSSLFYRGDVQAARKRFEEAISVHEQLLHDFPEVAEVNKDYAWLLCTCPEISLRDEERAVQLARTALELGAHGPDYGTTLSAAECRAGHPHACLEAATKVMEITGGGDAREWYWVALAYDHLDETEQAREWFDKADRWRELNMPNNIQLRFLHNETASQLELKEILAN
jgi:tetratricopeptide (TPR) repeat protein